MRFLFDILEIVKSSNKNVQFSNKAVNTLFFWISFTSSSSIPFSGTSHDWRLRCDAVNLYYVMFGLTRPSCLPLPELGLVLNLKEKKAVLNPTIKPEMGAGALTETPASIGIHGVGMSYPAVRELLLFNRKVLKYLGCS